MGSLGANGIVQEWLVGRAGHGVFHGNKAGVAADQLMAQGHVGDLWGDVRFRGAQGDTVHQVGDLAPGPQTAGARVVVVDRQRHLLLPVPVPVAANGDLVRGG